MVQISLTLSAGFGKQIFKRCNMKSTAFVCFLFLCALLRHETVFAQQFLKLLDNPAKSYAKQIARFANGDLLIGDSPLDGQAAGQNRGVSLARLDPCGNEIWAKSYGWGTNYLEFKDFIITNTGDIYVLGSAYRNFEELIFLLKLNKNGDLLQFRLFNTGTIDHFTYSISAKGNQVMVCGLLLGWDSQKEGFIALFDEKLRFQWGKRFSPFESFGAGIIAADGGFLCRSGSFLAKLSSQGELQWTTVFTTPTDFYPFAGPLAVPGGYVLEAYGNGFGFFYKIDLAGNLVWKSDQFPTAKYPAGLSLHPDGTMLANWNSPGNGENFPSLLRLSPEGAILQPRKLVSSLSFNTGRTFHSLDKNNTLDIVGSTDPYNSKPDKVADFLFQFPLDVTDGDCYRWEPLETVVPNDIAFGFQSIDTIAQTEVMTEMNAGSVSVAVVQHSYAEICDLSARQQTIAVDTFLPCEEPWLVHLPGPGFTWDDENLDNPRLLTMAGEYRATDNGCATSITYVYTLRKGACKCPVYIPNIFSPNQDGWNDRLEISTGCALQSLRLRVYDRWGNAIFESNTPEAFWDGAGTQKPAMAGVYLVAVEYTLLDDSGQLQKGSVQRDVTLLR